MAATFQRLGKYECLKRAVYILVSMVIVLFGICLSTIFEIASGSEALSDDRERMISVTSACVTCCFAFVLFKSMFWIFSSTSGIVLPRILQKRMSNYPLQNTGGEKIYDEAKKVELFSDTMIEPHQKKHLQKKKLF